MTISIKDMMDNKIFKCLNNFLNKLLHPRMTTTICKINHYLIINNTNNIISHISNITNNSNIATQVLNNSIKIKIHTIIQ